MDGLIVVVIVVAICVLVVILEFFVLWIHSLFDTRKLQTIITHVATFIDEETYYINEERDYKWIECGSIKNKICTPSIVERLVIK